MRDGREAGAFVGHTEGLTYVDSKGDGRYVLSNGKDQTMKLWDLRKMMTTASFAKLDPMMYTTGFDYRFTDYTAEDWTPHPHDNSVVTFRGHRVLKTLIRCHFSPPNSTNSRYVYTGSEDGCVWVYNLDGTVAGKIDVGNSTKNTRPRHPDLMGYTYEDFSDRNGHWRTCVRDASWHPNAPILAGMCSVHRSNEPISNDHKLTYSKQQHPGMATLWLQEHVLSTRIPVTPILKHPHLHPHQHQHQHSHPAHHARHTLRSQTKPRTHQWERATMPN